jgi:hypothetical protein
MLSASSTFCSEQHQHAAAVQVLLAEKRAAGIHIGGAVLQALRPALRPACCSSAARRRGALQRVRGRQATAPNVLMCVFMYLFHFGPCYILGCVKQRGSQHRKYPFRTNGLRGLVRTRMRSMMRLGWLVPARVTSRRRRWIHTVRFRLTPSPPRTDISQFEI